VCLVRARSLAVAVKKGLGPTRRGESYRKQHGFSRISLQNEFFCECVRGPALVCDSAALSACVRACVYVMFVYARMYVPLCARKARLERVHAFKSMVLCHGPVFLYF
jgi:hypothetical protein